MVHALAIAAAATAGVSVAVAFELAVFKPWRDENWPDGVAEGVRSELLKLRDDFGLAVSEIREDVRTLRAGRRRADQRRAERLRDDELDDFRQGVGEEHSAESGQYGFEMHEREAEAYRDRLRASFAATHVQQYGSDAGLRRRQNRTSDSSAPHHPVRSPSSSTIAGGSERPLNPPVSVVSQDLAGLEFAPASSGATVPDTVLPDAFTSMDGSTSSWTAAFERGSTAKSDVRSPCAGTPAATAVFTAPNSDFGDLADHMALETNGLSQTISDQNVSHRLDEEQDFVLTTDTPSVTSQASDEGYDAEHDGSDDLAFEMLSVGDSDNSSEHWSALHSPSSPPPSEHFTDTHRGQRALEHVPSEGESWAEISSPEP